MCKRVFTFVWTQPLLQTCAFGSSITILQNWQLIAQADVVIVLCLSKGILVDKYEVDVALALTNAAQCLHSQPSAMAK